MSSRRDAALSTHAAGIDTSQICRHTPAQPESSTSIFFRRPDLRCLRKQCVHGIVYIHIYRRRRSLDHRLVVNGIGFPLAV